ncbi:MAG: hypothetical protein BGO49_17435 [Planctomycetales bacterium 71-10]|nr:MAG: hypothetical protein BGO49_17435 [Planctomycetales bacterium 71-10]
MDLDEFLISQETSESGVPWPLDKLDEILATPPIGADAPAGEEGSASPDRPTAALIGPLPQGDETRTSVLHQTPELASALVEPVIVAAPTAAERAKGPGLAPLTSSRVDTPGPRIDRSPSSSLEVSGKLGKFLVTAREPIAMSLSEDVERIESEFLSKSPLIQSDWGSEAAATSSTSAPGGQWPMVGPIRPARQVTPSQAAPLTLTAAAEDSDGASGGSQYGNDYDRIEGRLSQVADRLERVVERFAAPPPIGSRPRPFRGRVDG